MNLNRCVLSFLNSAKKLAERKIGAIEGIEICDADYKTNNEPPREGWRPYEIDLPLTGKDAHFWFRAALDRKSVV